jgi:hypothetical protein
MNSILVYTLSFAFTGLWWLFASALLHTLVDFTWVLFFRG